MIGFELWQSSGATLRRRSGSWFDRAIDAALATTDRVGRAAGIQVARMPEGAPREVPYSLAEWDRRKREYEDGVLRELAMGLAGQGWSVEVWADVRGVAVDRPPATHLGVFLDRENAEADRDPLLARVDLLEEGARLGATGGRMGPSSQGGLTWWENMTGRHHNGFWPVAERCIRGPDFALLLGPRHIEILGGLERLRTECPCERIEVVDGTDLVLLQLAEDFVINEELEQKALRLEEYLSPLLDW